MTAVIESIDGHYEVHKTLYGESYVWCPGCVVVECDCGERPVLSASETICSCGTHEWRKEQDEYLLSEETYWLELSRLD